MEARLNRVRWAALNKEAPVVLRRHAVLSVGERGSGPSRATLFDFPVGDEEAPTMIDNLMGFGLIASGGEALEIWYESTDRQTDLAALRQAREATQRAAQSLELGSTPNFESVLSQLPAIAANPQSLRGLRWEFFTLTNTLSPCLNLNRIVFGPDVDYERWVEDVRASLVRFPSEAELFDLALRGYFAAAPDGGSPSALARLLSLAMGRPDAPGSCAGVFQRLSIG